MSKKSKEFYSGLFTILVLGAIITGVFIILKLTGVISWSYWVIFLPLLIAVGIPGLFLVGLVFIFLAIYLLGVLSNK